MIKRWLSWPEIPLALGAAVLFIAGALLIAQLIVLQIKPGKPMKLDAALFGVQQTPAKVALSISNLLDGNYQVAVAHHIGTYEPYYATAVRLRNQVEFSLFHVSPIPRMVYGTGGQLLQIEYIDDYCTRNLQAFMTVAPAAAARLRQIQNIEESLGQTFLYIITPSKVAQYPDDLPSGMPCPSAPADRTAVIPAWAALVRNAGVHMVDTTSLLFAQRGNYPFRMFPKGGTHWNQVGSALGAQAIEAALQAQLQNGVFTPPAFTWQMSSHATGMDTDLATLMNLFWLGSYLQVPDVTFHEPPAPPGCKPVRITIVGGSFMENIGATLSRLPCGATVVQYFYWKIDRFIWKDGVKTVEPVDPKQRDSDLQNANVILLEENEAGVARSNHANAFYQWLIRKP